MANDPKRSTRHERASAGAGARRPHLGADPLRYLSNHGVAVTRLGTFALAALVAGGSLTALAISDDTIAPGADPRIASTDVREVCATDGLPGSAYSRAHRLVKRPAIPEHQIDHIVPLCLGGADVEANIQVQPIEEALEKDELERSACRAVCLGAIGLSEAQQFFIERWGG
jgi:hypothetical protein